MIDSKLVVSVLNSALALVSDSLTKSQIEVVQEYIHVGEWSLALETLCSFLYEKDAKISHEFYKLIEGIGNNLSINSNTWKVLEFQVIT